MSTLRLESIVDAIAFLNNFHNPDSVAHQTKNPLLARAYSFKHISNTNNDGIRIFTSTVGGYRFAVQDVQFKCEGSSRAKGFEGRLKPESNLHDLLLSLRHGREEDVFLAIDYIRRALNDETITHETPLSFFIEGE